MFGAQRYVPDASSPRKRETSFIDGSAGEVSRCGTRKDVPLAIEYDQFACPFISPDTV